MSLGRKMTIALVVITIGWLVALVWWGPAPFAFSFDDAYYYFTIGRNWADGHASTFNQIDKTNGYHPLWQLIAVLPYLVGLDGLAAVRSLLALQLLLWVGAMWCVVKVVSNAIGTWPGLDEAGDRRFCDRVTVATFVVLCANPFLFKMTVNGLESGLVVPIGAVLLALAMRFRGRFMSLASAGQRWTTGGLLALAFLARTDAVILFAVLVVWCALDTGRPRLSVPVRLRRGGELFAIPVVVAAAYLITNQIVFDTALQISGVVKRLPVTPQRALVAAVWALAGLALLLGARRPVRRTTRLLFTRRFIAATAWYGAFGIGLIGYYTALQQVPYLWYFAPLSLYATFLVVLVVADLARSGAVEAAGSPGTSRAAIRAPAVILLVPLTVALVWSFPTFVDPGSRSLLVHDARAGAWIDANLPADARLASWDAGALGYFSRRSITSLDGVVNTVEWHEVVASGGRPDFLAKRGIDWVSNHGADVDGADPDIDRQIRALFGADRIRKIIVVYADTYPYSGTLDGSRTDTSTKRMGSYVYRLER